MKNLYEVAIVGGGFSGLVTAVKLNKLGVKNVCILESQKRVGKKILATGNGRGNVTNANLSVERYHGDKNFASFAIKKYDNKAIEGFFNDLGLLLTYEEDRAYPCGLQANAVLDALRLSLKDTEVFIESFVEKIEKKNEVFVLSGKGFSVKAKKVVLAFGGSAGQGMGTEGKSYSLAECFGHTVTPLSPSLVQLKTENDFYKGLKGVKHRVKLSLADGKDCKNVVKTAVGDLLFTDTGASGNAVFEVSSYLGEVASPYLLVEFLPEKSEEEIFKGLKKKCESFPNESAETLLSGYVHNKLGEKICRKIFNAQTLSELLCDDLKTAIYAIKRYIGRVIGTTGFIYAQVTHGGIDTKDVLKTSFESKKISGLYIIGEALNVDGDCGGFNLQWAFSSAVCAAEDIYEKTINDRT